MQLSIMKPIMAQWMIDLYDYLVSRPDISINGYHAAGIKNMYYTITFMYYVYCFMYIACCLR